LDNVSFVEQDRLINLMGVYESSVSALEVFDEEGFTVTIDFRVIAGNRNVLSGIELNVVIRLPSNADIVLVERIDLACLAAFNISQKDRHLSDSKSKTTLFI